MLCTRLQIDAQFTSNQAEIIEIFLLVGRLSVAQKPNKYVWSIFLHKVLQKKHTAVIHTLWGALKERFS